MVLYILNILLGRFDFVDTVMQMWFGKFGLIDLVFGSFGVVPNKIFLFSRLSFVHWLS